MATTTHIESTGPVKPKERSIILDALRGLALLGICLADSGYGSEESYRFMQESGIEAFVKYNRFHKEQRPRYTPNPLPCGKSPLQCARGLLLLSNPCLLGYL